MNTIKLFVILLILSLCYIASAQVIIVKVKPAVARHAVIKPTGKAPHGKVWIPGYWIVKGNTYIWKDGYYTTRKPGYRYYEGYWRQQRNGWVWVPGKWKRIR